MNILIPSPIKKITFSLEDQVDFPLYIKRDELIHPYISGNKWRKLSIHIASILKSNAPKIATCGGPWSNHLLAAASAAHIHGIKIVGFVRGDYHLKSNPMLDQALNYGMELRFISNSDFTILQANPQAFLLKSNMNGCHYIPFGGDDEMGQEGCQAIVSEVLDQNLRPDIWLIPAGTGSTATGVISAINYPCRVYVFPAINRESEIEHLRQKLNLIHTVAEVRILPAHRCSFGRIDEALLSFLSAFYERTDILLDPLYNGKMFEALHLGALGELTKNSCVLAYHSGGLFGWSGIKARYSGRFDMSFLPDFINTEPDRTGP